MKWLLIKLIRFYQKFLSPLKKHSSCRFTPTCSTYAIQALEKRGAVLIRTEQLKPEYLIPL